MSYDAKALNRVKRIEGQVRMIEEGKDCKEVITQLSWLVRQSIVQSV